MLKICRFICLLAIVQSISKSYGAEVNVWPYPQSVKPTESILVIDSTKFPIVGIAPAKCDLLDSAILRTKANAFIQDCSRTGSRGQKKFHDGTNTGIAHQKGYKGQLSQLTIHVKTCEHLPHLDMNENYTLVVNATSRDAYIQADAIWGAIRGLETFTQLVTNVGHNQFAINETQIKDFPRFGYRGLLVDTSRHYIPVDVLKENLDAMSYNKLNVFHWHIVDDQSFPYVSKRFPDLSLNGSYDPSTHVYIEENVQDIIEYARQRGIRVVVEFDSPGHTLSWGKGQKNILTECYNKNGTKNGLYGPIDPTKDNVYQFIEELFSEVTHKFADQYFHLGGDEVDFSCWESNPDITKFMKARGISTYSKLEDYYMQKVLEIVKKLNKSYIIWEEVFNNGVTLKPDTVVHVWIGSWGDEPSEKEKYWRSELFNVTEKGYRAILSSCWYLDLISYGSDWTNYYKCEPHSFNGTDKQKSLVIGGEAAIWAEYINAANFIGRTWPRASATAERLWSPRNLTDPKEAKNRFHRHNCNMMKKGIRVEPNEGPGFCRCDYAL